jgi:hypothetical protein
MSSYFYEDLPTSAFNPIDKPPKQNPETKSSHLR